MEQEIKKMEDYFATRRALLPRLQELVAETRRELDHVENTPENHVPRSVLKGRMKRYAGLIREVQAGRLEKNFQKKIEPFLQANKRLLFAHEKPTALKKRHRGRSDNATSCKKQKLCANSVPVPGSAALRSSRGSSASCGGLTKREMLEEYLTLFDGGSTMPEIEVEDMCHLCNVPLVVVDSKAQATCTRCGCSKFYIDSTTANMQYNHDLEFSSFSYKRVNHFNDWLAQIQARETNEVSDDVIQKVVEELQQRRVVDIDSITIPLVREVLKKLKLRKAYEHTTQIVCRLTGQPAPRLHPHLEECCRIMFIQIQPSFEKHKGRRKNMLSYSYTLFKFLQLLGVEDIPMLHLQLLRGREKLSMQDEIFAKVCRDLNWEFIPSVTQ